MTTHQLMLGATPTPPSSDPYFDNVTTLLHGDGTNGAQNNTFIDSSTNNFTITRNGNTTQGSFSSFGENWSNQFNGSTTALTTAANAAFGFGTGDFTVEFWVNFASTTNRQDLVWWGVSATDRGGIIWNITAGNLTYYISPTVANAINAPWTPTAGYWYHIALCRSSGSTRLFIDGIQAGSTYTDSKSYSTSNLITIGKDNSAASSYFNGYISNLRIIKGTALYTSAFVPSTTPLQAVSGTSLLTCQSSRFVDNSANNFTITLTSVPIIQRFSPFPPITLPTPYYSGWFDGTGDYLSLPTTFTTIGSNDFTAECWIYQISTSPATIFYLNSNTTSYSAIRVGIDSGQLYLLMSQNGTSWAITSGLIGSSTINQWCHVALTRSGTSVKLFLNGTQIGSTYSVTGALMSGTTNLIGAHTNTTVQQYINGIISNARVVNGTALYTSNFTPPTTPLTAVSGTVLLTCQSSQFIDNSTNNFAITVNGNAQPKQISPFTLSYSENQAYSTSVIGGSGYFDGSGDYLDVGAGVSGITLGSSWTIEFWIYPIASGGIVFDCRPNSTNGYYPEIAITSATQLDFYYNAASHLITVNNLFYSWNHIAVVKNSGTVTVYCNGVNVYSISNANTWLIPQSRPRIAANGGFFSSSPSYYAGYISNFRVVSGIALYTAAFAPLNAPLTAVTNTSVLTNFTNAGIFDNAEMNDFETSGNAQINTSVVKFGTGSMSFNGVGNLRTPDKPVLRFNTADFTVEGWFYLNTTGAIAGLIGKGTAGSTGWSITVTAASKLQFNYTTSVLTGSTTISANTWYYFAIVRYGTGTSNLRVYLNGIIDVISSSAVNNNFNQSDDMFIGAERGGTNTMNGYLDDLRITNGIARYTANFTPPTAAFPNS